VYACEIVSQQISSTASGSDLKDLILAENNLGTLDGVVLIGDLPSGWFEIDNDFNIYGYKDFPCDLYLMDLDGTWIDSDQNGKYESHTGEVEPELFVGRISTANMGTLVEEIQGMREYLDKNHDFWTGVTVVNRLKGLTYTDEDWIPYDDMVNDIQYLYGLDYDAITYGDGFFGKTDYLDRLNNETYEFVQLACHSAWYFHQMSGGNIFTSEIFNIPPKSIAYNLFCCSGCRWTDAGSSSTGFLGGVYVYNSDSKAMVATGSTKTGSMLGFSYFYSHLLSDKVFGTALKNWWIDYVGPSHDFDETCWFYGMSIIGDPMINPMYDAETNLIPPQNIGISQSGNDMLVNWDAVPNANTYTIYSSSDPNAEFPIGWTLEQDKIAVTNWVDVNAVLSRKFYIIISVN
ncbi:MAG: hypothetical protein KAS62_01035, partial [Candidatus Delongbacteria bacterium]|nr:hypothetical protein [Candidatus Delongbacteria bacterium]